MQIFVAGFLFSKDLKKVALIKKTKPEWQAGRLNGIGGKVEAGENPFDAMCREFREETGAEVTGWLEFFNLSYPDARIHFFKAVGDFNLLSTTDEEVGWYALNELFLSLELPPILPNLRWLIPFALDPTEIVGVASKMVLDESELSSILCASIGAPGSTGSE